VNDFLQKLDRKAQRGSKPRCVWMTHGSPDEVARRLTALAAPDASIATTDRWMPRGFENTEEAQLHTATDLLNADIRSQLGKWWLAPASAKAKTPNFDLASTCHVSGEPGLLLVEAKAHDEELVAAAAGRPLNDQSTDDRKTSHAQIGAAIGEASGSLSASTGLAWRLSRDSHYQMSSRFAWAWKLASLGVPVVLVYLGFLRAEEMARTGSVPLADHAAWERLVRDHAGAICPPETWGKRWSVDGRAIIPLIRSVDIAYDRPISAFVVGGV
jgi:hypothetical protein